MLRECISYEPRPLYSDLNEVNADILTFVIHYYAVKKLGPFRVFLLYSLEHLYLMGKFGYCQPRY